MRKRYLHNEYPDGAAFWTKNWDRNWDTKYTRHPSVDPRLVRHIEAYLSKGMVLLEGGCGDCMYVKYFSDRGYSVVGVDYSEATVRRVNGLLPELDVRYGDTTKLDFQDDYFDAYYSGGVIEHSEDGVDRQLAEARRVLKPGGLFFVTVPNMNASRRLVSHLRDSREKLDMDGMRTYLRERVDGFKTEAPPDDYHFHEYNFTTNEMRKFLARHNFTVVREAGFSAEWGLADIELYRRLAGIGGRRRSVLNKMFAVPMRLFRYCDGRDSIWTRTIAAVSGELIGNLKLYVCENRKPPNGRTQEGQ